MRLPKVVAASTEILLVFPSVLFMTALFARNVQPVQYEPAHTAQRIVDWYAGHTHIALWLFLMLMPLAVFVSGALLLRKLWREDPELRAATMSAWATLRRYSATALIAASTAAAAGVLAIVALHSISD